MKWIPYTLCVYVSLGDSMSIMEILALSLSVCVLMCMYMYVCVCDKVDDCGTAV